MYHRAAGTVALGLLLVMAGCGSPADLRLSSLRCGSRFVSLQTATGTVENISARALRNVVALVTFRYANRSKPVTVAARIQSNDLLPGSMSRFEARTPGNLAFSRCDVVFVDESGHGIEHVAAAPG